MKYKVTFLCRETKQTFGPTRRGRDATRKECRNTVRNEPHSVLHTFTLCAFPPSNVAFSCRRACGRLGTSLCFCPLNGSPLASVIGQLQRLVGQYLMCVVWHHKFSWIRWSISAPQILEEVSLGIIFHVSGPIGVVPVME